MTVLAPLPGVLERMSEQWRESANCADTHPDLFYPSDGKRPAGIDLCDRCPVRVDCLAYALMRPEPHGTWGGMSERARDRLKRRLRRGTVTWAAVSRGDLWPEWDHHV